MNIFVGNLAFTTTEQELRACFEAYGTVETVRLMTDRDTGGFVANFTQEVVKRQLPLSVEGIRRPGSRTVRPQCGPRFPLRPPSAVSLSCA